MTLFGGYQSDFTGSGEANTNGAVFITDITPQSTGNVGGKVFDPFGQVLKSAFTDTDLVRVHILAQTGNTNYHPTILVAGQVVTLTEDEDRTVWEGFIDIDLNGATSVTAVHEDGVSYTVTLAQDIGPQIQAAVFTGGYPGTQTELKAGDTFDVQVTTDTPMSAIEVFDFGAATAQTIDLGTPGTTATITVTIADRGNTPQALGVRLQAANSNGAKGATFETASAGTTDGVHTVILNNQHPVINISTVNYPAGQGALKNNEEAIVQHTIQFFDTVTYSSPVSQLDIPGTSLYESAKSVGRMSGSYNVSTPNFRVEATRAANDASTVQQTVVRIANVAATISLQTPARMRSGGNAGTTVQEHTVTLNSDQLLNIPPQITAPQGALQGTMADTGTGLQFVQRLRVHDNDPKGDFAFTLVQATNLSGLVTDIIAAGGTYTLGGFVSRTIQIPAFANQVAIGTHVSDVSKVSSLDKDLTAMIYLPTIQDRLLGFTITDDGGGPRPDGNFWRWLDNQAVGNNTTGGATVTLEEAA